MSFRFCKSCLHGEHRFAYHVLESQVVDVCVCEATICLNLIEINVYSFQVILNTVRYRCTLLVPVMTQQPTS